MSTDATHFATSLDLGHLGRDYEANVTANIYRPPVKKEDDYPEVTIWAVWVTIAEHRLNILPYLPQSVVRDIEAEALGGR